MSNVKRTPFMRKNSVQTILASLLCVLIGLLIGFGVLAIIHPASAGEGMSKMLKSFMNGKQESKRLKDLGSTLVRTAPLLMCSLSVLFAYKVGLFNIGAAGQYVVGAGASIFCALQLQLPWYLCMLAAVAAGALWGAISGVLKAYRNVNEVISCIMLNWIGLYCVNMLLMPLVPKGDYNTYPLVAPKSRAKDLSWISNSNAKLPDLGMGAWFNQNKNVTIAIVMAVAFALLVWVVLNKTKLGYELKATGLNKHAARYSGMHEHFNIILAMAISGALAGLGASMYFLTDIEQWNASSTALPSMGFNGIAAAFLGGLNPIGCILSSFFLQHITDGGSSVASVTGIVNGLSRNVYVRQTSDLVSAMIIYLCGFVLFFRILLNRWMDRIEVLIRPIDDALFDNPGAKLIKLIKALCVLGMLAALGYGVYVVINESFVNGLVIALGGTLACWLVSLALMSLGKCAEYANLREQAPEKEVK